MQGQLVDRLFRVSNLLMSDRESEWGTCPQNNHRNVLLLILQVSRYDATDGNASMAYLTGCDKEDH
jgi:hypothetical protein